MTTFDYGPVEFYAIGFDGDRPGPAVLQAIDELVKSGIVKLLDLVFARRSEDGELSVVEFADSEDGDMLALELSGLAGEEDIEGLAADLPPGSSAAILVVELVWAKQFSQALFNAGGAVIGRETVPAPVVNLFLSENEN